MEYKGKELTKKIFSIVGENWPIHSSGICRLIGIPPTGANVSKIDYHIKKLRQENKVQTKRIDRALVVWPSEIEKIRLVHDFIKDM
jgi:predicted transcriptional regulator